MPPPASAPPTAPDLDDLFERQPHARAVLSPALAAGATPSHAYLFHGPPGTGKRAAATGIAATLLAQGAADPDNVRARVASHAHPDLTWVTPSGAHEMLVGDVEEPVVAAAARTPFEAERRVFVIERADTLGEQAANKMLKTLEEPAAYVHLILLTDRLGEMLPTIVSRCQLVRFDPRPAAEVAERIGAETGAAPAAARAAARLALGDATQARWLAGPDGAALRERAEGFARAALDGTMAGARPWRPLLEAAEARAQAAGEQAGEGLDEAKQLSPKKEHRRLETETNERVRRAERRDRTAALDLALALAGRWYLDLAAIGWGAAELVANVDRAEALAADADACDPQRLRAAAELVEDTRRRLQLNVTEELACEVLGYRLAALLAA